ncbi:MAG TPA: LiaF domain-containing protein [Ktedonobacterales bacterium]|nr:LiaF domain-containing protein [Ktedonobacterales bacterium]
MDQQSAIEELRERYARGGLPLDEFRRVMGQLMVTTDPAECQAILDALPPEPSQPPSRAVSAPLSVSSRPVGASGSGARRAHHISAFFGTADRTGSLWELGPETLVSATFGEARLDVRMARLSEGENVLRLNALFGEIKVIVPQGMRIYMEGSARFGEVKAPGHGIGGITMHDEFMLGEADTSSYLRIEATATFGEIKVIAR